MNITSPKPHIYLFRRRSDNSPVYVGKHKGSSPHEPNYITSSHDLLLGLKKNGLQWFWRYYSKEILCFCTGDQLNDLERKYIREFNTYKLTNPRGYNYTLGGDGGDTWSGLTERQREARAKKNGDSHRGMRRPPRSQESKDKQSRAMKGRKFPRKGSNRENYRKAALARPVVICPHCSKRGQSSAMVRWHFNNCKHKI